MNTNYIRNLLSTEPCCVKQYNVVYQHAMYVLPLSTQYWEEKAECLARNQDNASENNDVFTRGLLYKRASTTQIQISGFV